MSYKELKDSGELEERASKAFEMLESCTLCPRNCKVNRLKGELGVCRAPGELMISSYGPHFGEEKPLVGSGGSGTIFLTHCGLRCIFCQNFDISHLGRGDVTSFGKMARMMISLQNMGCHNINFVTPTHYVPHILKALTIAIDSGLTVPLVYNCGGYESLETLKLMDGVIDIYMPDFKYASGDVAARLSKARDYPDIAKKAVKEMHRQVGDLVIEGGIAVKGLLVRHLVLPEGLAGTKEVMEFLAKEVSENTYVNVMDQYYPSYKARDYRPLDRKTTREEYKKAIDVTLDAGITNIDGYAYYH